MTTTAAEPAISDEEIRDWAKSTGRLGPDQNKRGRIPAALRAEYERIARDMQVPPPGAEAADADADAQAAEPAAPRAARGETKPRPTPRPRARSRSRIAAWLRGDPPPKAAGAGKKKPAKDKPPRRPLNKFASEVWGGLADAAEHWNVPVARCMDWQSPYVGQLAEETIAGTFIDRIVQPIVRGEEKVTTAGAVLLTPAIVAALQLPGSQPDAGPLGVVRYQLLSKGLEQCVATQLEAFGADTEVGERLRKSAEERAELKAKTEAVIGMIWAAVPDPQTADEAAAAAREEQARRQAAADAAQNYVHRPGAPVVRGYVEPDNRGQAAEAAAAAMAEAGRQAAAIAQVHLGTAQL